MMNSSIKGYLAISEVDVTALTSYPFIWTCFFKKKKEKFRKTFFFFFFGFFGKSVYLPTVGTADLTRPSRFLSGF